MTLKNSLAKHIWHNMKRRTWCFALFMILYFFALPVYGAARASNIKMDAGKLVPYELSELFGRMLFTPTGNLACSVVTIIAAIICAISGFIYLNQKNQIDLYHSLPIKRAKLLLIRLFSGFILFVVPFLCNVLLALVVTAVNGQLRANVISVLMKFVVVELIYFLATYHIGILAMLITGNNLTNILMMGLLYLGPIVGKYVYSMMKTMFYSTYVEEETRFFLSPIEDLFQLYFKFDSVRNSSKAYEVLFAGRIWWMLALAVIVLFILFPVYYRRPSESAGRAIAFGKVEWLIKLYVSTLVTLTVAILSRTMIQNTSFGWYLGAFAIGFILVNAIVEIIFRADFKEAFRHFWGWGINLFVVSLIFCSMYYDWMGYDRSFPKKENVKSMGIQTNFFPMLLNCYEDNFESDDYYRGQISDFDEIYELAQIGIANVEKTNPFQKRTPYVDYEPITREEILDLLEKEKKGEYERETEDAFFYLQISYQTKHGQKAVRNYALSYDDERVMTLLGNIYEKKEMKEQIYPVITLKDAKTIKRVEVDSKCGYQDITLSESQSEEFSQILAEEYANMTFEQKQKEVPIALFTLYHFRPETVDAAGVYLDSEQYYEGNYPIYASSQRTIDFLEGVGARFELDLTKDKLIDIRVETINYCAIDGDESEYPSVLYQEDSEKMQEIYQAVEGRCATDYTYYVPNKTDPLLDVNVTYLDGKTGRTETFYARFKQGEVPGFVYDDMIKKIKDTE